MSKNNTEDSSRFTFGDVGGRVETSIQAPKTTTNALKQPVKAPIAQKEIPVSEGDQANKIQNKALKDYSVKRIVDATPLEPLVIVSVVAGEDDVNTVGIPGFYDPVNERFMLLDGSPVPAEGFDEEFGKYIKAIKEGGK